MEKQFVQRIKIIKEILGEPIDEIALAATVLHKEDALEAVKNRYDENFKEEDYRKTMETFFASEQEKKSDKDKSDDDFTLKSGVSAEQIDLLNAAAIIMAASAGWTEAYNEEKYQEALADDGLITENTFENDIFCGVGRFADAAFTVGNVIYHFASGQDVQKEIDRTVTRWNNMENICKNGYVGGVYNLTKTSQPDDTIRKLQREEIAEEIINLIHYYKLLVGKEEEDSCDAPTTTTGDFASWKQFGESWSGISVGGGGTIGSIGCLATSVAIQIARSGTKITNTNDFNPGTFVTSLNNNGGFVDGGSFAWTGHGRIAPNFKYGESTSTNISNTASLAKTLSNELSTKAEGKYQKYIVLQIHHNGSSQHWVAVDSVSGSKVTIFDPGANGTTLDDNYSGWVVDSYRVMYATDVTGGSSGSGTASTTKADLNFTSSTYKSRIDGLKDYEQCGSKLNTVSLGNSTICQSGCMVASLAAIQYMYTGQEVDVQKLIKDMIKEGEWSNSAAGMGTPFFDSPTNSPLITSNWGLSGETLNSSNKNTVKDNVIKSLKEGKKILLNLGGAKTTYSTGGGHFLMLDHYNSASKKIYIFNPGGSGTGYISEGQLMSEVLAYNKYGPWAISSDKASINDPCGGGQSGSFEEMAAFITGIEGGSNTCNNGKGYTVGILNDGAGLTAANGVTQGTGRSYAAKVGYSNYDNDFNSGCVDKQKMTEIQALILGEMMDGVKSYADSVGVNLKYNQLVALTGIRYGGDGMHQRVIDTIKKYGENDYHVFQCMVSLGCGFDNANYLDGLSNRRASEYEVYRTGNYKAVNPGKGYSYYQTINSNATLEKYMNSTWPTGK